MSYLPPVYKFIEDARAGRAAPEIAAMATRCFGVVLSEMPDAALACIAAGGAPERLDRNCFACDHYSEAHSECRKNAPDPKKGWRRVGLGDFCSDFAAR